MAAKSNFARARLIFFFLIPQNDSVQLPLLKVIHPP